MSDQGDSPETGGRKKSWRGGSPAGNKGNPPSEKSEGGVGASPPSRFARPATGRRFTGGKSAAMRQGEAPRWYRLLAASLAFLLTVSALVALLLWVFLPSAPRPLLVAWSVTDFSVSSQFPPNDFALADVELIQASPQFTGEDAGIPQDTRNMQTEESFRGFFERTLRQISNDTIVVYLSAHGISRNGEAYLMTSEASDTSSAGWYPVSTVIEGLLACPARNKLLLLDSTRIDGNLELGLLGNDFQYHLTRQFERIKGEPSNKGNQPPGNLWILCSSSDGEMAWASPSLEHSIFGLAAAYCLHGGPNAEIPDSQGETDGYISAKEIHEYTTRQVAAWALNSRDKVGQVPLLLAMGPDEDFKILPTESTVQPSTLMQWAKVASVSKDAKTSETPPPPDASKDAAKPAEDASKSAAETTTASPDVADSAKVEKATPKAETKAEPKAASEGPPTRASVIKHALALWSQRESMARQQTWKVLSQPLPWTAFQDQLIRAERLLLAGRYQDAEDTLGKAELNLASFAKTDPVPPPTWSLAFVNEKDEKDPLKPFVAPVQMMLDSPDAKNLDAIKDLPLAEAGLLRALAEHCRVGDKWTNADLVKLAMERRKQAEQVGIWGIPEVFPFVASMIDAADADRRRGDLSLILGRDSEANNFYREARAKYEQAAEEAAVIEKELRNVFRMALDVPYLIQWLGIDLPDRDGRVDDLRKLEDFLVLTLNFEKNPGRDELRRLAKLADDLYRQCELYAQSVGQFSSWRQSWASLQLPFLETSRRETLLSNLFRADDNPLEIPGAETVVRDHFQQPSNPFPLAKFFQAVARREASDRMIEILNKFDPANPTLITRGEVFSNADLRNERATAGAEVLELLRRLQSNAWKNDDSSVVGQELRVAMVAALVAAPHRESGDDELAFRSLRGRLLAEVTRWRLSRFARDDANLPRTSTAGYFRRAATAVSNEVPPMENEPHFAAVANRVFQVPLQGKTAEYDLQLECRRGQANGGSATLILDWNGTKDQFELAIDGVSGRDGRLSFPLPPMPPNQTRRFRLAVRSTAGTPAPGGRKVWAWIERPGGAFDWLDLRFPDEEVKRKAAEVNVAFKNRAGSDAVIDLFPGQELPVAIEVVKNVADPMTLRLEFHGGDQLLDQIDLKAEGAGPVPVTSPRSLNLPIVNGELRLLLYRGQELLDDAVLQANMIAPEDFLDSAISYDPRERKLSAQVSSNREADGEQPIRVRLHVAGIPDGILAGKLEAELKPEGGNAAELLADLPKQGVSDRELIAILSLVGYPRAVRYRVGVSETRGSPYQDLTLRIAAPPEGAKYGLKSRLPITVEADGPKNLGPLRLRVGDDDGDPETFDSSDKPLSREYPFWRDIRVRLTAEEGRPGFKVYARADDVTLDVPANGLQSRRNMLVEVIGPDNRRVVQNVHVYFLAQPPSVTLESPMPGSEIALDEPISLVLRGNPPTDAAAIDALAYGFDKNGNGMFDMDERKLLPLGGDDARFGSDGRLRIALPPEELKLGPATLVLQAITKTLPGDNADPKAIKDGKVDMIGPEVLQRVKIVPSRKPAMVKTGTIIGKVTRGGAGVAGYKVTGVPGQETTTGSDGKFTFNNVKPGMYELKTERYNLTGQAAVTVEEGANPPPVEIKLSLKGTN
ncbi:MAG: hypothetical protein U1D30_04710 [Planctomycetota bacterium]